MVAALSFTNFAAGYGQLRVVRDLNLECAPGKITVLLGRNGAGKTTTLHAVAGLLEQQGGAVSLFGEPLTGSSAARVRAGVSLVQEGKRIFRARTVEENLRLGAYVHRTDRAWLTDGIEQSFRRFPILEEKRRHVAGTLSGGQQQMLAIAQALMAKPRVLLLDEPSAGLAPAIVEEVFNEVASLKDEGLTVLLIEQLIDNSLAIADHVAVLDHGTITVNTPVAELASWDVLRESDLGAGAEQT
jgi:branched-chain amino acid transport system ATP-binding protein